MISTGNPNQWGRSYPKKKLIEDDINNNLCHVICENGSIYGVFALFKGQEPTYSHIENGEWLNDDEYITVHRIAGSGKKKGIFGRIINYCKDISDNIRIDTHENNQIMQKLIEKNGFQRCGTIFVADGSPRIAYQWIRKWNFTKI